MEWRETEKYEYLLKPLNEIKIEDIDGGLWMSNPYRDRKTVYGIEEIFLFHQEHKTHCEFKPFNNISILPDKKTITDIPTPSSIFLFVFFALCRKYAVLIKG